MGPTRRSGGQKGLVRHCRFDNRPTPD